MILVRMVSSIAMLILYPFFSLYKFFRYTPEQNSLFDSQLSAEHQFYVLTLNINNSLNSSFSVIAIALIRNYTMATMPSELLSLELLRMNNAFYLGSANGANALKEHLKMIHHIYTETTLIHRERRESYNLHKKEILAFIDVLEIISSSNPDTRSKAS